MRILLVLSLLFVFVFVFVFVFAAPSRAAQKPRVDRIDIISVGLFKSKIAKKMRCSDCATGTREIVSNAKLLRRTTEIAARLGKEFGFFYRIIGAPKGAKVSVQIFTIYPGEGLRNPKTGKLTQRDTSDYKWRIGPRNYSSYHFDHDWEMVPGVWTFEVWHDGKKFAEQKFTVTKP